MTYAEDCFKYLKDKMVEVYIGDQHEQMTYSDNTQNVNAVICGKLIGADGDLFVLDSFYKDKGTHKMVHGNVIYINATNIIAICELNGVGTLRDAIHSYHDTPEFQPGGKFKKP